MKFKFIYLFFIGIAIGTESLAQNKLEATGNVGIGTQSPLNTLDVRGGNILVKNLNNENNESVVMIDHSLSFGNYQNWGTSLRSFTQSAVNNTYALQFFTQNSYLTGQTEKMRINGNGNVGIGLSNPLDKLSVNGNIRWGNEINYIYSGQDNLGVFFEQVSSNQNENKIRLQSSRDGDESNYAQLFIDANNGFSFQTIGNANGNVGIGTTTPNEKLAVNGNIRAKEVKVEASNWPDYVFEADYKNIGLAELDAYIKKNKHLPEMPKATDVEKSGIEVADMIKRLLKNQEELTLHLIEKDKQIDKLEKRLSEMESRK